MNNKKEKIRIITTAGVLLALILVFLLVPMNFTGFVDVGVVAIISVLIGCQFVGLYMGLFCGLSFGLASLLSSFTTGAGALLAPAFHNPLISVVPRVLIPVTCYFTYVAMRKVFKSVYSKKTDYNEKRANRLSVWVSSLVASVVGVVTNTGLVMSMLFAFHGGQTFGNTPIGSALLIAVLSTNFPIELAICAIATPSIVLALKSAFHTVNDKYYFKKAVETVDNVQTTEPVDDVIVDDNSRTYVEADNDASHRDENSADD